MLGDNSVHLETLFDVVLLQASLRLLQVIAEFQEGLLALVEFALLSLVELVFFLQLLRWLNLGGRSLGCYVEEIDVCLQISSLHELDRLGLSGNLLLQFKVIVLLLEVISASSHILLVLSEPIAETFFAILLKSLALGLIDKLVSLLLLRLLLDLTDLSVWVNNWS